MTKTLWIAAVLSLCAMPIRAAAPNVVVDAVQMPAWVVHQGKTEPLVPGMGLHAGDEVRTGKSARAYLRLAEGSTIKLGEQATFKVQTAKEEKRVLKGIFDVLKGAFRFTTGKLAKLKKRDVSIRVSTVTVGIRGTDLWGKSGDDRDFVLLLEGHISLEHTSGVKADLTEPNSVFSAPRGQSPEPVSSAAAEQIQVWAAETEIQPGGGSVRGDGRWKVVLLEGEADGNLFDAYSAARKAGYPARIATNVRAEKRIYEVAIYHLAGENDAHAVADRLKQDLGLTGVKAELEH